MHNKERPGFEQRQALSGLKQQVAGLDPLTTTSSTRAAAGLGSFSQPFPIQAQQLSGSRSWYGTTICTSFYVSLSTTSY